jgi:hypothetical protein
MAAPQITSTGPKCLSGGIVTHDQQLPGVPQVAGQEDDQADLGKLGRLEHEQAWDAHAEVGPVDGIANDGEARQDHQA